MLFTDNIYTILKGKSGIYSIKNTINNKSYIGSSLNLGKRLSVHIRLLRDNNHFNPLLQHSYNKYKEGAFIINILEFCNEESLKEKEEYYILNTDKVFNIDKEIIRHRHPKHIVELIANKNRGQKRSTKTKSLISEKAKLRDKNPMQGIHRFGEAAPMYDKKHTENSKLKMSNTKIKAKRGKAILAIKDNIIIEFSSAIQASKELNIPQQNIYECLKGKRKSAKNFNFKYKEMEEVKKEVETTQESKKLSYTELENIAHQLSDQAKQLYAKLQEANMENMFKRLDYLFKVLENNFSFSEEFVKKCASEIEDLITVPEEELEDSPAEK